MDLEIRPATEADVPLILTFIRELADYERLSHEVVATEEALRESLFGESRFAEVLLGYGGASPTRLRALLSQLLYLPRQARHLSGGPLR
jgi:hypothetical protein